MFRTKLSIFPPSYLTLLEFTDYLFWNALSPLDVTFDRNYLFFCRTIYTFSDTNCTNLPRIEPSQEEIPLPLILGIVSTRSWDNKTDQPFPRNGEKYENNNGGEPGSRYVHICYFASIKTDLARFSMARGCTLEKWRDISFCSICALKICKLMEDILNMPHNIVRASVNLRSALFPDKILSLRMRNVSNKWPTDCSTRNNTYDVDC